MALKNVDISDEEGIKCECLTVFTVSFYKDIKITDPLKVNNNKK